MKSVLSIVMAGFVSVAGATAAMAQKAYGPGVTDVEIKIGNTNPYSGPASAYGLVGRVEQAYFKMVNEAGGVNGRKINFISYDDAYSPPKTVEQTRKLVESDEVFAIVSSVGTPTSLAVQKYLNIKKVPQLFVLSGAGNFNMPKQFPWSMSHQVNYSAEGRILATYIMKAQPKARSAFSTRTTISERTCSADCSMGWAKTRNWSSRRSRISCPTRASIRRS